MIDADPLFADPMAHDFHLRYTSPCLDAGDATAPGSQWSDFEGDPRTHQAEPDLGADEFHRHLYHTGTATSGGAITVKIVDVPATAPVFLWVGTGMQLDPTTTPFGDWYLVFPLVFELPLGAVPGPDGLIELPYVFPAGTPVPWDIPLQALSGPGLTNPHMIEVR